MEKQSSMTPIDYLQKYSGRIVSVGDTFDHKRSSIIGETQKEYLDRIEAYWCHIEVLIKGNHDAILLEDNFKEELIPEYYKKGSVLAFHGHQLCFSFNRKSLKDYEFKWKASKSEYSLICDIEEWIYKVFNKYFKLDQEKAADIALNKLKKIDSQSLLTAEIDTIITGHTHLAYDVQVIYKDKKYRVINLGSPLYGKEFNPVYIPSIDKLFVSDLHLGTNKSLLN